VAGHPELERASALGARTGSPLSHSWSFGTHVPADSSASHDPQGMAPGTLFGSFTIEAFLGEGLTARVYRARDARGELVALKVSRARLDPGLRERFAREGELAMQLSHPGLVGLRAGGEVDGAPFLAFDLVEGRHDLLGHLETLDLAGRVRIYGAVAEAVGYAHAEGVVHRDLKHDNILVDASGQPRVTDLGLALGRDAPRLTQTGEVLGTPRTMAPEQTVPGRSDVGPPADVWALGVMLYEALTGQRPFPAANWLQLRDQIQAAQPPSPRRFDPRIPEALEAVVLRALSPLPEQRYPDAGTLAQALAQALVRAPLPPGPGPKLAALREAKPEAIRTPFPLGRKGRFQLLSVLGKGAMGVVYRALDPELGREVALKFVAGEATERRIERFRREGQVTASLNHPNILRVHDAGVEDGTPYLVYELVEDARTLDDVMGQLDLRGRLTMLRDAARALGFAHAQGVLHRDVKPENLLVDQTGRLLVADFGLAAAQGLERMTRTGALVGTPHYMAPELITGDRDRTGPPTDVWALGVILFEMVCGERPFAGSNLLELGRAVTSEETPRLRQHDSSVDWRLEAIALKALQKDPQERYAGGEEMACDLDAFLEGRRPTASTASSVLPPFPVSGRRAALLIVPALAIAIAGGVVLSQRAPPAEDPGGEDPPPAVEEPGDPDDDQAEALRQAEARQHGAGEAAWRDLQRVSDLARQVAAARSWLDAYPDHPRAAEVEQFLKDNRFRFPLRVLQHDPRGSTYPVFLPDGRLVCSGNDGSISTWDPETGALLEQHRVAPGPLSVDSPLARTPNGVVVGMDGAGELMWEADAERRRGEFPLRALESMVLRPDGGQVALSPTDGDLVLFTLPGGERLASLPPPAGHSWFGVAYSPDSRRLIAVSGPSQGGISASILSVWDAATGEQLFERETQAPVRRMVFSEDGRTLVMGTITGKVVLCDGEDTTEHTQLTAPSEGGDFQLLRAHAHVGSVRGLALSADGLRLFSASKDKDEIRVWDLVTNEQVGSEVEREERPTWLALSPDGRFLALGTRAGFVELWAAD
jgi:serine/threonine protein kinase